MAKRRKYEKKWLEFDVLKSIIENTKNPMDRLVLKLQYDSASRVTEILRLKRENIDLNAGSITLEVLKSDGKIKTRFLSEATLKDLRAWLKKHKVSYGYIFPNPDNRSVYVGIAKRLRTTGKKIGITGLSTHWMRSSRAVHLLHDGHDIQTVREELAHQSINSTEHYIRESGIGNKKVMEKSKPKW